MVELFTATFGYRHAADIDLSQSPEQIRDQLQAFALHADRSPDDHIVLYAVGGGSLTDDGELTLLPDESGAAADGAGSAGADAGGATDVSTAPDDRPAYPVHRAVKPRQLIEWLGPAPCRAV